jgi:putative N6-adenine-specific DNA methylase
MSNVKLIATATFGVESLIARELADLGYGENRVENGRVSFHAPEDAICRCNLWLRCADRVLLVMGEFAARSFEELFQGTRELPWERWLGRDACFPVTGTSVKSQLFSISDCQAIIKKAVVERLKSVYHESWFPEDGPLYPIRFSILKDKVTLSIDTSGAGLHKRGYRPKAGEAPLKETLAAAMIRLSRWREDRALIDPCCGSGTIPIEAALMAMNRAPGLNREFTAEAWPVMGKGIWDRTREEAHDLIRDVKCYIYGSDIDESVLSLARIQAREAGVEGRVFFQKLPAEEVRSRFSYGHLITNPPYGKRLGAGQGQAARGRPGVEAGMLGEDVDDLEAFETIIETSDVNAGRSPAGDVSSVYRELGQALKSMPTWSLHMLTALDQPEQFIGRRWDKSRKLYNGRIECHYYQFFGPKPPPRQGQ